jgi:hypothetical protein
MNINFNSQVLSVFQLIEMLQKIPGHLPITSIHPDKQTIHGISYLKVLSQRGPYNDIPILAGLYTTDKLPNIGFENEPSCSCDCEHNCEQPRNTTGKLNKYELALQVALNLPDEGVVEGIKRLNSLGFFICSETDSDFNYEAIQDNLALRQKLEELNDYISSLHAQLEQKNG